jgi:2-polyprenyl-3-methyl-5-hydroxy-6-metoxy-1,4-benzoquinol methylase
MVETESRENLNSCPVCGSANFVFLYDKKDSVLEIADRRMRCKNCSAVFTQNRLSSEFIIWKFYQKRNSIGPTEKYLKKKKYLKKIANRLEEFLPKGSSVFDIGCGGGALLKFLLDKGYKVSGLEVSEQAKGEAERVIGIKDTVWIGNFLDFDPVRSKTSEMSANLPSANLTSNGVDAVLMTDVIEHLANPHLYFKKISDILKPNGLLAIRTPNSDSLMHKILQSHWMLASPRHVALYSFKSLSYLLKQHDFQIIHRENEVEPLKNILLSFSYGIFAGLRGFFVNILRWFFSVIGAGESITIFARKN